MSRAFLARLLESYFRHRWLNLAPLVLMIVAAVAWLVLTEPEYVSQGTVYVQGGSLLAELASDETTQSTWSGPAKATAEELDSLLQSDAFVRAVIARSDLEPEMNKGPRRANDTLKEVRRAVWTQTLGQNMVQVGAAHTSPRIAQQLSTATIQNYIQWRVNNRTNEGFTAQSYFERLIPEYADAVKVARQDLQAYLLQHPDPVRGERPTEETFQIDRLQAAVQEATQRLSETIAKAERAKLAGSRSTIDVETIYSVIDEPPLPIEPSTSKRKQALSAAVFMLAGLLLSGVVVVAEAFLDTSLRFPADVQQKLNMPVLAAIPDARPEPGQRGRKRRARTVPGDSLDQSAPASQVGGAAQRA